MKNESVSKKLIRLCFILVGLLYLPYGLYAQSAQKKVEGVCLDADGAPLIGLTVTVKGTTTATITNLEGKYTINARPADMLVFSYIGYQTQELTVGDRKEINVVMREATVEMEDVVIVGYGTQKKISVTGAIANASIPELQAVPTASFSNALAGQLPGLISAQHSGEPGFDGANLYVRGWSTFSSYRYPLVFVDGIERDINIVNPAEVESFSILKDASATAVYGVRGANGVILITTKKGKMGKAKVSFRSEYAMLQGNRFPEFVQAYEFATLMNEANLNIDNPLPWSADDLQKFRDGSDPYMHPNVDWIDEVFKKNTWQTSQNVNISGGNEAVRYYINIGYMGKDGLYKEDPSLNYETNGGKFRRYNLRSNIDVNVTKEILVELGIATTIQDRGYQGTSASEIWGAIGMTSPLIYPVKNPDGSIAGGGATGYLLGNPYGLATQTGYTQMFVGHSQGNLSARWDLSRLVTKGLSIAGKFSFDYKLQNEVFRRIAFEVKQITGQDEEGNYMYQTWRNQGAMGYSTDFQAGNHYVYYEGSLNYDRTFGDHNVTAMLLFNRSQYVDMHAGSSINNLPARHEGMAGRLVYNFANRYITEFNFGYNGSEQFPKENRYGFFPALSLGWVVSNEGFWNDSFVNHLKLRASVGKVGNDGADGDRYLYITALNPSATGYMYGSGQTGLVGIEEKKFGVPLRWETSTKYNAGIDIGVLNKFNLTFDIFKEKREGILLKRASVPYFVGLVPHGIPYGNVGEVDNKGFDGSVEFKNTTAYGLTYSLKANISFAQNTLREDDSPEPAEPYQNPRGRRMDSLLGLVALGLFETQEEIDAWPRSAYKNELIPGDVKYQDVNEDGIIDDKDRVYMGYSYVPDIMYGFGGSLRYKCFDALVHFAGVGRRSTFLTGVGMYPFSLAYPNYNVLKEYYDNRWIPGADNSDAVYPTVRADGANPHNNQASTLYLRDASYLKLQNAEIGFTVPRKFTDALGMESIRFFVNGNNLLTFDKLKIIDPEQNLWDAYPLQRVYNIGAQINF
ncbi:MAG: TonB-dependent receptor [Dysgonamonadaceae bacterium]|nr:TonB-dependent receptor [Dysgonamonadaceae bacterium]